MPTLATPAARRAGVAVIAAIAFSVVAPVAIWFDDRLVAHALLGQGVVLGSLSPSLRAVGIVTTLLPSLCLAWGLLGVMPALRSIGRGGGGAARRRRAAPARPVGAAGRVV